MKLMDVLILGEHLGAGLWESQAVGAHLSAVLDRREVVTVEGREPPGAREKLHVTFFFFPPRQSSARLALLN